MTLTEVDQMLERASAKISAVQSRREVRSLARRIVGALNVEDTERPHAQYSGVYPTILRNWCSRSPSHPSPVQKLNVHKRQSISEQRDSTSVKMKPESAILTSERIRAQHAMKWRNTLIITFHASHLRRHCLSRTTLSFSSSCPSYRMPIPSAGKPSLLQQSHQI